jgi:hypothetical protein
MNIKSESGQAEIAIVLILAIVAIAAVFGMMAASQRGMQAGADAIGEAAGAAIDSATGNQELENEIRIAQNAAAAWVGSQRALQPNEHAILNHGDDAWATVRCYNKNGTFHIMSTQNDGFHLLCRDDDGSVRDLILKRRVKDSNEFDMVNAYTPQDGTQREVIAYVMRKFKAGKATMPGDSIIYVDGILFP